IIEALYGRNMREEQHAHKVSELCENMGKALGLLEVQIEELKTLGLFHDIGKIAVDESILNKEVAYLIETVLPALSMGHLQISIRQC
uniref:HD domain-containing protein n=1 Tax=Clostridium sp. TaxID=1506 RepID=UPI0035A0866B